ncbi:MAG: pyridoxamine 5'-phosphate oxidase family protein [Chloroflexota bacterium]|nr:pyridoxamine 5'-phosphate oxidase family protein [Chloroflexota bacterium]
MAVPHPIPDELTYLLTTDLPGHVAFVAPDGSVRIVIMWVDYDGEHVLTSSRIGSFKARVWRRNPHAAVSVVDKQDMWRFARISGRVTEIKPDTDLAYIDKLSRRYTGEAYRFRDFEREIFVITPDRITASTGRR